MLEVLTPEQWHDWLQYYDEHPWGEQRKDLRQWVLIRYLRSVHEAHQIDEMPKPVWPYYELQGKENLPDLLTYMESIDKALVPKEGGGYELTAPLEQVLAAASPEAK